MDLASTLILLISTCIYRAIFIIVPALRFYGLCDDYMLCLVLSLTCAVTQGLYYLLLCEQTPFSHTYLDDKIVELHNMTHLGAKADVDVKPFSVGMARASHLDPGSIEPADESLRYSEERERLEAEEEQKGDCPNEKCHGFEGVPLSMMSGPPGEPQSPYIPQRSYDDDSEEPTETQRGSLCWEHAISAEQVKAIGDRVKRPEHCPEGGQRDLCKEQEEVEEVHEVTFSS